jgi:hypothetical protein
MKVDATGGGYEIHSGSAQGRLSQARDDSDGDQFHPLVVRQNA